MLSLFFGFISLCVAIVGGGVSAAFWALVIICCVVAACLSSPKSIKEQIQRKPPTEFWEQENNEITSTIKPFKIIDLSNNKQVLNSYEDYYEAIQALKEYRKTHSRVMIQFKM